MTTKAKEILTSTLEGRFKKLHDAANFAEESCKAIAFHAEELKQFEISEEQYIIIEKMDSVIDIWCNKFVHLAEQTQEVESIYWENLSEDKSKCVLIEEVPSYSKTEIPNIFQMTEKLFDIGYFKIDGISEPNQHFSKEGILANIKELQMNIVLCIKALANANYKGIWKPVEETVFDIYDFEPGNNIFKLLKAYGVELDE
jgi:hypothetical protein